MCFLMPSSECHGRALSATALLINKPRPRRHARTPRLFLAIIRPCTLRCSDAYSCHLVRRVLRDHDKCLLVSILPSASFDALGII